MEAARSWRGNAGGLEGQFCQHGCVWTIRCRVFHAGFTSSVAGERLTACGLFFVGVRISAPISPLFDCVTSSLFHQRFFLFLLESSAWLAHACRDQAITPELASPPLFSRAVCSGNKARAVQLFCPPRYEFLCIQIFVQINIQI